MCRLIDPEPPETPKTPETQGRQRLQRHRDPKDSKDTETPKTPETQRPKDPVFEGIDPELQRLRDLGTQTPINSQTQDLGIEGPRDGRTQGPSRWKLWHPNCSWDFETNVYPTLVKLRSMTSMIRSTLHLSHLSLQKKHTGTEIIIIIIITIIIIKWISHIFCTCLDLQVGNI